MTCKELHEQITAYVDDRVDQEEYRQKVQQHITYCPDCRAAFELELKTKMVVRQSAQRVTVPDVLRQSITEQVDAASQQRKEQIIRSAGAEAPAGWLDRFADTFMSPLGVGLAVILVIIGAYVVFVPEPPTVAERVVEGSSGDVVEQAPPAAPENFFNKAAMNFAAILEGNLKVQHATGDQQELAKYFRDKGVAYSVSFPKVRAQLAGGVVSEHGTTRFAHLVYTVGDTIIYLFEVPKDELRKGAVVYVTPDVMNQLEGGKVFWEEPYGTMRLVMFRNGDIICAAVSNAPRRSVEQLLTVM